MNLRSTLILTVLAIVAVIAAVLVERAHPIASAQRQRHEPRLLLARGLLPVEAVRRIELTRGDEPTMVFERRDDRWLQTAPVTMPMDAFSIAQLPKLAAALQVEAGSLDEDIAPITLGLDPPLGALRLIWDEGEVTLRLGRRSVAGRAYLQVAGLKRIFVVSADLHERLEMDDREWRDRRIFHHASINSDSIRIVAGNTETELVRDRRQWTMTKPLENRVNPATLNELFQALGRAKSGGFVMDAPTDLAKYGLAQPAGRLAVTTTALRQGDGEVKRRAHTETLLLGNRIGVGAEDRFGMIEGRASVFRVPEAVWRALFRPAHELLDPTGTGTVPADVKSIRINGPGGDYTLQRDLERWSAPEHNHAQVNPAVVEELLTILCNQPAIAVAVQEYPRDQNVAMITFSGFGGRVIDTVRIAREPQQGEQGGRWIFENGDNVLRFHPPGIALPLYPVDFGLPVGEAAPDAQP